MKKRFLVLLLFLFITFLSQQQSDNPQSTSADGTQATGSILQDRTGFYRILSLDNNQFLKIINDQVVIEEDSEFKEDQLWYILFTDEYIACVHYLSNKMLGVDDYVVDLFPVEDNLGVLGFWENTESQYPKVIEVRDGQLIISDWTGTRGQYWYLQKIE